jgi:glucuronate isomerase
MSPFITEDFLLQNKTAVRLYHEYAEAMPIYDYHCHLPVRQIAEDHGFENITQAWLRGDHYKWRAMRTNGVPEDQITGQAGDYEKFVVWAQTVPYTMRNPLYHWTHLELKRYFGIDLLLGPDTAERIFEACSELLKTPEFSVRNLLRKMHVNLVCTTEDPLDTLDWHQQIKKDGFEIHVHTAWRPDKALGAENPQRLNQWFDGLGEITGVAIKSYSALLEALQKRHDQFAAVGCCLSDYGLETVYAEPYTDAEIRGIFTKLRSGQAVSPAECLKYKSALLYDMAAMDARAGWVLQLHLGALRNANTKIMKLLGADTGCDSIGDFEIARPMAAFLDRLNCEDLLPKTILYNLNPRDNELIATMIGNFQDGSCPGKMQYGSAWWFLDQKDGMEKQIEALSNMGLLSRFVGMLTDSRSFLSFPRHEYFRRILCNKIGQDVENGLLPADLTWLGKMVRDVCYNNACEYFGMECGR